MVSTEEKSYIQNQLAKARAALDVAKKDIADMERAGLKEQAADLRRQTTALDTQISQLASVYGTA